MCRRVADEPFAVPTCDAGTERLVDFGPGNRSSVSRMSPYIRYRLVTERAVIRASRLCAAQPLLASMIRDRVMMSPNSF